MAILRRHLVEKEDVSSLGEDYQMISYRLDTAG